MATELELNKINMTEDYEKFKFLDTNRELYRPHVEALKKDIALHPEILRVQPILVNKNMFIIDGQHRYTAAKELELPIYYLVAPEANMAVTRRLNVLQRGWGTKDFAHSFAATNHPEYKFYLEMIRKYGFNHTITMAFLLNGFGHEIVQSFRRGELQVFDRNKAEANLSMFSGVVNKLPVKPRSAMAKAFIKIVNHPDFDYDRLLQKLDQNEGKNFYMSNSIRDYLHMFEDVYNWGVSAGKVRLY